MNMNDNKSSGAPSRTGRVGGRARQDPDPQQVERKKTHDEKWARLRREAEKRKKEEEAEVYEKRMRLRVQQIRDWGEEKKKEARKLTMTAIRRGTNSGSKNFPLQQKGVVPHAQQDRGEEAWERYKKICASSSRGFNDPQTTAERISVLQEAVSVDSQLLYR